MPRGTPTTPAQHRKLRLLVEEGYTLSAACRMVGVAYNTGKKIIGGTVARAELATKAQQALREAEEWGRPKRREDLRGPALDALDDFGLFRRRYFGRISSPWQEEAALRVATLLETPQKEFAVVNCPPGSGKSTLFTHDIPAWLIVRNRAVRMIIGSRAENQAVMYVGRLRRSLERVLPVQADSDELAKGRALDAVATLPGDYGSFRPAVQDVWRQGQFIVEQFDNVAIDEKEPTVVAFGMNSASLGWRVNFVVWDDVVDKTTISNMDTIDKQRNWWDDEAETRLEPDGLLVLQGQRLSPLDLYRYNLDKRAGDLEDDDDTEDEASDLSTSEQELLADEDRNFGGAPKYHHVIYKAHYDELCTGRHTRDMQPYPQSCLLDPVRLRWKDLTAVQKNRSENYRVVYQQEDVDPAGVLVPRIWIEGGRDPASGEQFPGCWDRDRGLCEIPRLTPPWYSIATVDPSSMRFWAVEWWLYHPASEQRFLIDLFRDPMTASEFLDWNENSRKFFGLMEDWQDRSARLNAPITHWIVEKNGAQRYLLAYDHVRRWQARWHVSIIPHTTGVNKLDEDHGIWSIRNRYKFGNVRLPRKQSETMGGYSAAHITSLKLVSEATRFPKAATTDCLMAQWFLEYNLPALTRPAPAVAQSRQRVPSWLTGKKKLSVPA